MKQTLTTILLLISLLSFSQKKELYHLWPGKVPGETKEKQKPVVDTTRKELKTKAILPVS